jgi:hypothetical protein
MWRLSYKIIEFRTFFSCECLLMEISLKKFYRVWKYVSPRVTYTDPQGGYPSGCRWIDGGIRT